ncbi:tetratricopeptide repeat protein [Melioribacteraceae bacterium 4301-Me]|uniref:tetratricopeptide repeat protein n=1 Tax=Pyranulibacter aquaticus TaxID=3163344 RepID=UPI00359AF4DB
MKIKPLYIYLGLFIVAIALVIVLDAKKGNEIKNESLQQNIPNDEIHKGLTGDQAPSKSNLRESAIKKMEELRKAVEANPNDTAKVKEYAMMLAMGHQPQKAIELFEGILAKDSKRIDILLTLSFLYYNQGNFDKAEQATQKILAIDKNQQEANFNLGVIAEAKQETQRAKEIFENVIKKFPNTDVAVQAQQALEQLKAKKSSK